LFSLSFKDEISDFTVAIVEREVQELKHQKLQKMNQEKDIQINADGMTIYENSSFDNPLDNVKEKLEEMKNQTSLLLEELKKDIDTALAILSVKTLKLNMLRTLLNDIETNGTAPLARRLNVERSRALKQAASIPLDLEMVGVTAEERLLSHASVSVVLDVFETLNS
jgi:type I restriction-modification system DNA methylase subunit